MKPIIGLTSTDSKETKSNMVDNDYIKSIREAGGLAVSIPTIVNMEDYDYYLDLVDGLVFTGGSDILPIFYGENPIKEIKEVDLKRDQYEMELFKRALSRDLPVLGVCRGLQLFNVVLGGSLYQDLYSQRENTLGHDPIEDIFYHYYHEIHIEEDSLMMDIFGQEKIRVNSLHHQAIKELGKGLVASSHSSDGIIESIEGPDNRFLLATQFHPEALSRNYKEFLEIFKRLIKASLDYRLERQA